ncbi:hypothetical protein ACQKWADRAFT_88381 [Trichoderma austrokoningii]
MIFACPAFGHFSLFNYIAASIYILYKWILSTTESLVLCSIGCCCYYYYYYLTIASVTNGNLLGGCIS